MNDYNITIDERNVFDQHARNDLNIYEEKRKIAKGQREDCASVSFVDYSISKKIIT